MKSTVQQLSLSAAALYLVCSDALARPCGSAGLPPCEVPEPSTVPLIVGAVVIAALVAKFRK